jgi:hypothetical protein
VVAYAKGGRKGAIWLPEGCEGWGWSWVVAELQHMLAFLEAKEWPLVSEVAVSRGKQKGGSSIQSLLHGSTTFGGQS